MTRKVLIVAPFPGPISGQTISTQRLYHELATRMGPEKVRKVNIARGISHFKHFVKLFRAGLAALKILTLSGRSTSTYISVDANYGMYLTLLYCICARVKSSRIILHHHTYSHIITEKRPMRWITAFTGNKAIHVCICEEMSNALSHKYSGVVRTESLSNIFHVQSDYQVNTKVNTSGKIVLGHMSRLSKEKGVATCLEVHRRLKCLGVPSSLLLAGGFANSETETIVKAETSKNNDIIHLGEITGKEKTAFFQSLDFFLFPSTYQNETQGIVNLEALAVGVPVLAVGQACLKSDLSRRPEWLFSNPTDYTDQVPHYITRNIKSKIELRKRAFTLYETLKHESRYQLDIIADILF